jgi:uncharacterized protein YydD (DUF2326 family)
VRLVSLYSNREEVFPPIDFHDGVNAIFAKVQDARKRDRDSHNLGKTFLIEVIDFTLLKTIDKSHTFRKFSDLFGDFVFFLQILTPSGESVTVRRAVEGKKPCSIYVANVPHGNLVDLPEDQWTEAGLSVPKAETKLNHLLHLTALRPYGYRKGLGYVMRRQSDWDEVFWLDRFRRGRDKDWKPYVAKILGFDPELVSRKYELEDQITALETILGALEQEAGSRSTEYGRVQGLIELKEAAAAKQRAELNQFSFKELEAEVSERGVRIIEEDINRLNERRYTIDYEMQEIARSLETNLPFDLGRIRQVFEEAAVAFPESLSRSYEELLDFNRRLSTKRAERLSKLRDELLEERVAVVHRLEILDNERQKAMQLLRERETFQKYLRLQSEIREQDAEIAELRRRLDKLDTAATTQRQIQEKQAEVRDLVQSLSEAVRRGNHTVSAVRRLFSDYVQRVLNVPALLSVTLNEHGNLVFDVQTLDRSVAERETSEAEGTSYRKILCACFDLALLSAHSNGSFYHFVFHDGVLEGLDNRKKVNFVELIRDVTQAYALQHIMTVIDADLPRDDRDEKLLFSPTEVVRELHDQGDAGRLFRMQAF